MKKLLMGSIVLTCFAFSLIAIQISCQKSIEAQTTGSTYTPIGKIIFRKVVSTGIVYTSEIWTANYDGSNAAKVNIVLPAGIYFDDGLTLSMSPNGQKIFFTAGPLAAGSTTSSTKSDIYSCNADGSSVTKIVDKGGANNTFELGHAY